MNLKKMKAKIMALLRQKNSLRDNYCLVGRLMIELGYCVGHHSPRLFGLIERSLDSLEEEHKVFLQRAGKRYLAVEVA